MQCNAKTIHFAYCVAQDCAAEIKHEAAIVVFQETHGDRAFSFEGKQVPLTRAVHFMAMLHLPTEERFFPPVPPCPDCSQNHLLIASDSVICCYRIMYEFKRSNSLLAVLQSTCELPGPMCVLDRELHWNNMGEMIWNMMHAVRKGIRANVAVFERNGVTYKYLTDAQFEL